MAYSLYFSKKNPDSYSVGVGRWERGAKKVSWLPNFSAIHCFAQ